MSSLRDAGVYVVEKLVGQRIIVAQAHVFEQHDAHGGVAP